MVLFIMLYKVIVAFESVDEILKCDHSNENQLAVLCMELLAILNKLVLTFYSVDEILKKMTIEMNSTEQYFSMVLFIHVVQYFCLLFSCLRLGHFWDSKINN